MNKNIIIIGIIILFLSVALSGCNESEGKVIQPGEIRENPEKYLNKTVTVKGIYSGKKIVSLTGDYLLNDIDIELPEGVTCTLDVEYEFTGIVKEKMEIGRPTLYLDVTSVKRV
jgi:hypothetical protein